MPELGDAGSLSARRWRSAQVPSSADSGEQRGTRVQQTRTGLSQPVALNLEQAEVAAFSTKRPSTPGRNSSSSATVT
jgi:hypothetical protein